MSFASSSRFLIGVWVAGLSTFALSFLLTVQVLRMRARATKRARRRAEFLERWRPLLFDAALGGAPQLPSIDRRDEDTFLALWNEIQDALHADAHAALNDIAERVGAAARARAVLNGGEGPRCIGALRMLGHLRRAEDYATIARYLDDPRQHVSLAAVRAVTRIDSRRAARDVLSRLGARPDWPVSLLVTALRGVDGDAIASELKAACAGGDPARLVRVIPLVALTDDRACEEILRSASASTDPEVTATVLKYVRTPALADVARAACHHEAWTVRTQAASALGRIGSMRDQAVVAELLCDRHWWVRYRAAQALVKSQLATPGTLAVLREDLSDPYARDILDHVAAEARP